jgi:membrane protease YdiL (CAAX protease family)
VQYQTPPHGGVFALLGRSVTQITPLSCISAAGEELGWRGYMLPRLVDAGVPYPILVSGLISAAWHLPLILSGQYASSAYPILSAAIFVVDVVGIGFVIGVIRLRSGSIWPAIILHGAWNAIIQGPFDQSATGPNHTLWVGESGVLVAVVSLAFGLITLAWYKRWLTRRCAAPSPTL